ncbi:hypothetical protein [Streptomyces phaeolivaceus]|uniref:hypothetical protein n=1 Tax=Streptomyces phaeolivaceus TaxID=2653200 RepID=UPI001D04BC79|nr:hypothetical protein [Streptomyces phaeolivaceus]
MTTNTNTTPTVQNAITWPDRYLPGTGDNFVSNEVVVRDITASQVWRYLTDTSTWESYYDNVADISFPEGDGPELRTDVAFTFGTFGFPPLAAHVVEFQAQAEGVPGPRSAPPPPRSPRSAPTRCSTATRPGSTASSPRPPSDRDGARCRTGLRPAPG